MSPSTQRYINDCMYNMQYARMEMLFGKSHKLKYKFIKIGNARIRYFIDNTSCLSLNGDPNLPNAGYNVYENRIFINDNLEKLGKEIVKGAILHELGHKLNQHFLFKKNGKSLSKTKLIKQEIEADKYCVDHGGGPGIKLVLSQVVKKYIEKGIPLDNDAVKTTRQRIRLIDKQLKARKTK
jgi:hypothetical protein